MKFRLIHIVFLLLVSLPLSAQQDALYSQYLFNAFTVNPAYAGSRQSMSFVALAREQWMGMDGAPSSQTFSVHSPFRGKSFAAGVNVINDKVGPVSNLGAFGTYAYHLRLREGHLSFGLRGGVFQSTFNQGLLEYKDESEVFLGNGSTQAMIPSFDFGVYYYGKAAFLGVSSTHLSEQTISYGGNWAGADLALKRHYMLLAGYAWKISDYVHFKPSTLVKYVPNSPLNVDVNASFLFYNTLWVGASYRHNNAVVGLLEVNVTDFLRVGYSYDFITNRLKNYNGGSHELFIGFDLNLEKSKSVSTRLL